MDQRAIGGAMDGASDRAIHGSRSYYSESVGQVLERHAIVGNLTRPFSMLTSDEKGIYRKSDRWCK